MGSGLIIGGDFPVLDTGRYAYDKLWIWLDKGGLGIYEGISRFPITSLWYILSLVGIDASIASKTMILLGFASASFSFYFSFLLFFRDKLIPSIFSNNYFSVKMGAIIGAVFFAYNVWSFNRIAHWHLWIGYSFIPLFFVSTYFSFRNPKNWTYILLSLFLWSFASMTPHMMVFYGIIFITIFLYFVFENFVTKQSKIKQLQILVPFFSILLLYVLVNFYWIYPYIIGSNIRAILPDYVVTQHIIEVLSRDSSISNTLRMVADWVGSVSQKQIEPSSSHDLWVIASFAIPIFAFLSLVLIRRLLRYTLVFSAVSVAGILLAMGTNSPIEYFKWLFGMPMLSNFIWLFRDPDKWSFLIGFGYSFLLSIGSFAVIHYIRATPKLNYLTKTICGGLFLFLLVGSICIYSYPIFNSIIEHRYKPISLPSEFDALNKQLAGISADKVYFMPYPLVETYWEKDSQVGRIYQQHSIMPSIESTISETRNYYNYLANSIMENRSRSIDDLIYPLGTSYLIFHNDTWNKYQDTFNLEDNLLLSNIYSLQGMKNIKDVGFYHVFKVGNETSRQINLFKYNDIAIGGLELLTTLNTMPDFSALNSSVVFIDNAFANNIKEYAKESQVIVTRKSSADDLTFQFIDNKYIVTPFDAVYNNDPFKTWSKVGAADPLHGEFHPFLQDLGISNREFDFGHGLVMTAAFGNNVTIPFIIRENGEYYLPLRLLDNKRGGSLNIYLDNELIDTIDTFDVKNSEFVWRKITDSALYLEKGKHTVTLQNVIGLNVVNVLGIIPSNSMDELEQTVDKIIRTKKVIYLLEAESNFHNSKGIDINTIHNIFSNSNKSLGNNSISGQFRVPVDSDLVSLRLENRNDSKLLPNINSFELFPAKDRVNLVAMDFERKESDSPLALLRNSELINYNQDALQVSRSVTNPIDGNTSLMVDVNPVNRTNWSILSTDLVPINDKRYYEFSMNVRANEVEKFHVRIQYYDINKKKIDTEIIHDSKSDSFDDKISSGLIPTKSSEFLKVEILVGANNHRVGTYLLDNLNLDELIHVRNLKFNLEKTQSQTNSPDVIDGVTRQVSTTHALNETQTINSNVSETDSIPVDKNHLYNYTANIDSKGGNSINGSLVFRSSHDVIENTTRYGSEASHGSVLSMTANSEIYGEVNVMKSANYTIAIRASICDKCKIDLTMDRILGDGNIVTGFVKKSTIFHDSKPSGSDLKWIYLNNTKLPEGEYGIRIGSDSRLDLDLVVMFSKDEPYTGQPYTGPNLNKNNFGNLQEDESPGYLVSYKKINPTKYVIEMENVTRPYVLSLAESYDPLWIAYTSNNQSSNNKEGNTTNQFKTNSIPLFSIVNGFQINKTGSYTLNIEYEPQYWFLTGAKISAAAVIILLAITIIYYLNRKIQFFRIRA